MATGSKKRSTGRTMSEPFATIFSRAQQALIRWGDLITATGGALAVAKCRCWAVDFEWNEDGSWQYRREIELPGILRVKDFDGVVKTVPRLETHEVYETLGVRVAPDGNHKEEYAYLITKATKWAEKLRTSTLREAETATALKTTILKTLEYPRPALFLSDSECNKLMPIVLTAALPKAKFNRTFCRRTLYAPGSYGGQAIANLKHSQIIAHADTVICHGMSPTLAGQQLRGSLEATKLELGLPGPLFSHAFKHFGHLVTDGWVRKAWQEFCTESLRVDEQTKHLQLSRNGDRFLIDAFFQAGYRNSKLLRLNRIRLRLQVVTVADISSGDGRYILSEAFEDAFPSRTTNMSNGCTKDRFLPVIGPCGNRLSRKAFASNRRTVSPFP
jgi:hypothetical protein